MAQRYVVGGGTPIFAERHVATSWSRLNTARWLLSRLGEPALPAAVLQLGCEVLGADYGVLYLLDACQGVVPVARYPEAMAAPMLDALDGTRLTWQTLRRSLPQIVDCAYDDEARGEYCHGEACWPTVSLPLQWAGQNFAAVQLSYHHRPVAIEGDMLALTHEYADLAALALVRHQRLCSLPGEAAAGRLEGANERSLMAGVSAVLAASETERDRIARDLHDGPRQALLGAQLHLEALREALLRGNARAMQNHLGHAQAALDAVEEELARIARDLYPPWLDDGDLSAMLGDLAERWAAATQIQVRRAFDPCVPPLEATQAIALYRIAQEALANASRHAGASSVVISLLCDEHHVTLVVADDGRGGASIRSGGIGLLSMARRAHAIGAQFVLDSPPGRGTSVVVRLPLDQTPPRHIQ